MVDSECAFRVLGRFPFAFTLDRDNMTLTIVAITPIWRVEAMRSILQSPQNANMGAQLCCGRCRSVSGIMVRSDLLAALWLQTVN